MTTTRADLYIAAWDKPLSQIAEQHGISVADLSRLCRQLDIPCPPKSYWHRSFDRRLEVTRPGLPVSKLPARAPVDFDTESKPRKRKGKSRLSPDQRRQQLLDAARQIIEQDGLAACTIAQVAAQADVSEALAFRYCRSRKDMLVDLARQEWTDQAKGWVKQVQRSESLQEKAQLFVGAYLAHIETKGTVLHLLLEVPEVAGELDDLIRDRIDRLTPAARQMTMVKPNGTAAEDRVKARALMAAYRRSGDLLANRMGSKDQCANAALVLSDEPVER